MPLRRRWGAVHEFFWPGSTYYSFAEFRTIVGAPGKRTPRPSFRALRRMRKKLGDAAFWYGLKRQWAERQKPERTAQHFRAIIRVSDTLIRLLEADYDREKKPPEVVLELQSAAESVGNTERGIPGYAPLEFQIKRPTAVTSIHWRHDEAVRDALNGLLNIRKFAERAVLHAEADGDTDANEAADALDPDEPAIDLMLNLARIYEEAYGTPAGMPNDKDGPFLRFLHACLRPLRADAGDDALRQRWRRQVKALTTASRQQGSDSPE